MNIIYRNFLRLVRSGAFATDEKIEPMTAWKWNRLYQLALMQNITPVIIKGLDNLKDDFFLQIPDKMLQHWTASNECGSIMENETGQAPLRLTNPFLNRELERIIEQENSDFDNMSSLKKGVNPPTLNLLYVMLQISANLLNAGISMKQMVEMGMLLRRQGHRIDFVKLQSWIEQLKMKRMAHLEGVLLMSLLKFEEDELPFLNANSHIKNEDIVKDIFTLNESHSNDWYFTQGKNIFVRANDSSAMMWHMRHNVKYSKYYPAESLTNIIAGFAHSLSHIEE